jgi:hypothetical protein
VITELQIRKDGKRAKRNRLEHVIIRDAGDYKGEHRFWESAHDNDQVWLGCWACADSLGAKQVR